MKHFSDITQNMEVQEIANNTIFYKNGDFSFCFDLGCIDIAALSNEEINSLDSQILNFLSALPENSYAQFILENRAFENAEKINNHLKSQSKEISPSDLISKITHARTQKLTREDKNGAFPKLKLLLVVRIQAQGTGKSSLLSTLLGSKKAIERVSQNQINKSSKYAENLKNQISMNLDLLGVKFTLLDDSQIKLELFNTWNPAYMGALPENLNSSLDFLKSDIEISKSNFLIGAKHHRFLSITEFPETSFASQGSFFQNLPLGTKLFLSIHIPDQQKERERLEAQRKVAFSMFSGSSNGARDMQSEAKLEDTEDALSKVMRHGERIYNVSLNFLTTASCKETLDTNVRSLSNFIRTHIGCDPLLETHANFEIFTECCFPHARCPSRSIRVLGSSLSKLFPALGTWQGHLGSQILLTNAKNNLIALNPFDSTLSNYNQIISGSSGAGKSYLTNLLLLQSLKERPKVYMIDIGGSYKKLCENLGGSYIPITLDSKIQINPFDLEEGETEPSEHQKKFLSTLVEIMTKEDDKDSLGKLEKAEIEQAIIELYNDSLKPRLSDLKGSLLQNPDNIVRRFGQILKLWTGDAPFGAIIDRQTNINLNSDIVCFDLKGLEMHSELQSVMLFLITNFLWKEMRKNPHQRKFLVFDECWKLLKTKSGADLIEEVFRTLRKMNGSAIAISQALEDFSESLAANALLNNSSIKWILSQKGADLKNTASRLNLNENEISHIRDLKQVKGYFSECYLICGDHRALIRMQPSPLENWIATTHPEDLALISEKQSIEPSKSGTEILTDLAVSHPHGA